MQYVYDFLGYDIKSQLCLMLYSLMLGAVLGAFFELFRMSRVFISHSIRAKSDKGFVNALVFTVCLIEDIAFAVFSAVILVLFCFKANGGTSRWFILFGALVGFMLYLMTLGRLISALSDKIASVFFRLVDSIIKKVVVPISVGIKKPLYALYKSTLGRILTRALRVWHELNTKKTLRELEGAISQLYIVKRKDNGDETFSPSDAGKGGSVRGIHNNDSHPRHHSDRIQSTRRRASGSL